MHVIWPVVLGSRKTSHIDFIGINQFQAITNQNCAETLKMYQSLNLFKCLDVSSTNYDMSIIPVRAFDIEFS